MGRFASLVSFLEMLHGSGCLLQVVDGGTDTLGGHMKKMALGGEGHCEMKAGKMGRFLFKNM